MPILTNITLDQIDLPNSNYGYSATRIDDLGATEYTIVTIACDVSGSTSGFSLEMEAAIKKIVQACKFSPRADNLLLRLVQFDDHIDEVHGFKLLENCHLANYGNALRSGGATALYDATENVISATTSYGQRLIAGNFSANAILFVMTDGCDNASKLSAKAVKKAMQRAVTSETVESLVSILIGVNVQDQQVSQYLRAFYQDAGFTQYIEIEKADANSLAQLADFFSRSILAQSQVIGSGAASSLIF